MFRLADRNSVSIKAYGTGREAADEALKAAKSQRLPDINASLSASFLGDGRLWNRDFSGGTGIDIPSFGNNFALEASQVIYAGGAVDSRIELAQIEKQMAELDWQKNRQDMHFLLLGWYLDLYKTLNQIKVLDRNLELADHVIENMQVRMEEGTVLKNDLTRYELQKETLELQRTVLQDGCRILNHQIVTVLHLPDSVKVVPDSSMLSCGILALEEQDWQQKAAQNSIDLRRSELGVRVNEQNLRLEQEFQLLVCRHRSQIRPFVSFQKREENQAGTPECPQGSGIPAAVGGADRDSSAGRLCQFHDIFFRPAYKGEDSGTCR